MRTPSCRSALPARRNPWVGPIGLILALVAALAFAPRPTWGGGITTDGPFVTTVPPGSPPLEVSSSTRVDNLNADHLDGLGAESFAPAADRVLVVSPDPSAGHFSSIQAALGSITDASAANRYLVFIGPGLYTEQVTMKPFVDVQGSGEEVTTIRWTGSFTVKGADDAALSQLTVENLDDGAAGGRAILNFKTSPRLSHLTVRCVSTANGAKAVSNETFDGVLASPVLRHVTATATGPSATAILNLDGAPDLFDVQATAVGEDARGITNSGDARLVRVSASATAATVGVGHAIGILNSGGTPELVDIEARASSGERSSAIWNHESDGILALTRVRAIADANGGSFAYAIRNSDSNVDVRQGYARAQEAGENIALYNDRSVVTVRGSRLGTVSSNLNYGVRNVNSTGETGSWSVSLHASQVFATTRTVLNHDDFNVNVGASSLAGSLMGGSGNFFCAGVYTGTFAFHASSCPLAGP